MIYADYMAMPCHPKWQDSREFCHFDAQLAPNLSVEINWTRNEQLSEVGPMPTTFTAPQLVLFMQFPHVEDADSVAIELTPEAAARLIASDPAELLVSYAAAIRELSDDHQTEEEGQDGH